MPNQEIKAYLGKTNKNKDVFIDFDKTPHLMLNGVSGCGKSQCLFRIIEELSSHFSPAEIRFLLVDFKKVDLSHLRELPHLFAPIVTEGSAGAYALECLLQLMKKRIEGIIPMDTHLFVVVDELCDLVWSNYGKRSIERIKELLEKGASANIHLILSMQVIDNKVPHKAFPARLVGRVIERRDCKCALDKNDPLTLQCGEMILVTANEKTRFQVAMVEQ